MTPNRRVLSIQSHVVHGYVGNKAAVFPLQLLGFDVDVMNSVHFSNHTGYPNGWEGDVLNGEQLLSVLSGLERNGLLNGVGHLLTGYIGSESFLRAVIDVLKTTRQKNDGNVRYICDPVLGDAGKFYVPGELVSIYRDEVIPLADVVTPNQFEVEQLTGIPLKTINDAQRACKALHDIGPSLVVITSAILHESNESNINEEEVMTVIASKRFCNKENTKNDEVWCIKSPILPGSYTGTGDLCAALLLGWTALEPGSLSSPLQKVIATMFEVIKATAKSSDLSIASKELRLIQSKKVIENPPELFEARRLS